MAYTARLRQTHRNIRSNGYVQAETALESPLVTADVVNAATTLQIAGVAVGSALAGTAAPMNLPLVGARLIADWTTVVATTAGTSLLGLAAAAGSALVGNAASGNTKNDKAQFIFALPAWYVAGSAITVRIRAKTTALSTVSDKISVDSFKINADAALGSDLNTTAAQQMTAAYANYSFTITPTGRVAGEMVQLIVATVLIDTGGTVGANGAISKIDILLG